MRILSLDVSSSRTGWAVVVVKGGQPGVQSFGLISSHSRDSVERIDVMVDGVEQLTSQAPEAAVIMEWHQGRFHGGRRPVPGLSILGQAQGAVRERLRALGRLPELISERDWTRGKPKEHRADSLKLLCPEYRTRAEGDKGFDAADAIGLAFWWLGEQRVKELIHVSHGL